MTLPESLVSLVQQQGALQMELGHVQRLKKELVTDPSNFKNLTNEGLGQYVTESLAPELIKLFTGLEDSLLKRLEAIQYPNTPEEKR